MLADQAQSLEQDLAFLQLRMNSITTALKRLKMEGERPGAFTIADLQTMYRSVSQKLAEIRLVYNRKDMPSALLLKLDAFSDLVINTGKDITNTAAAIVKAAGGVATGLGTTAQFLPFILIGLVVVVGIGLSKGTLSASVRR